MEGHRYQPKSYKKTAQGNLRCAHEGAAGYSCRVLSSRRPCHIKLSRGAHLEGCYERSLMLPLFILEVISPVATYRVLSMHGFERGGFRFCIRSSATARRPLYGRHGNRLGAAAVVLAPSATFHFETVVAVDHCPFLPPVPEPPAILSNHASYNASLGRTEHAGHPKTTTSPWAAKMRPVRHSFGQDGAQCPRQGKRQVSGQRGSRRRPARDGGCHLEPLATTCLGDPTKTGSV